MTIKHLFECLNININRSTLQKYFIEHPDYPSLLSISDVIKNYGVENVAAKLEYRNFNQLAPPFLVHIKGLKVQHNLFAVVHKHSTETIEIYNPESKKIEIFTNIEFEKIYQGTVLVVESNELSGETDYEKKRQQEKQKNVFTAITVFLIPLITIVTWVVTYLTTYRISLTSVIFTLLTLFGCVIGSLLLWHEIDEYNPIVKQICHTSKKVNCSAILNSDASKIFGLSWSSLGLTYFMGMLLSLLVGGVTYAPNLFLLGWINILSLPYIFFSIYYQWRIAKQWCVLCLIVQGLLFLQFLTAFIGDFYSLQVFSMIPYQGYLTIAGSFSIVFVAILILVPTFKKAKESGNNMISLQRLKHNTQIFNALLSRQKVIHNSTEGLGITIGKSNAKYKLIKVCNPYCKPCAKAHPIIDELLENNEELQVQILFTATGSDRESKTLPIRHLLAIAARGNENLIKKALDDWYLVPKKDYNEFAKKYPMSEELQKQDKNVEEMLKWCNETEITFTPTFFVNGNQLPEIYTLADLKYFLTV